MENPTQRVTRLMRRAQLSWYARRFDPVELRRSESRKFERLGLDETHGKQALATALSDLRRRPFDENTDSIHWLLFAALSAIRPKAEILEIGTYDGTFTRLLASLFSEGSIVTVDLPLDDPIMTTTYGREDSTELQRFLSLQAKNTAVDRVHMIKANSFFLLDQLEEGQRFDIVWVDGGHLYPEIAWDLAYALHLCRSGGWILVDDVVESKAAIRRGYTALDTKEALEYACRRSDLTPTYFVKRRGAASAVPSRRKYVAAVRV
jgi:predicted O-methyltransferase YrrM